MAKEMDESTKRRVRAGRMLLSGKGPTEVAKEVGVARQTVHTWKDILDEGGIDALRAMGGKGRPAQLDERQLEVLRRTLLDRPTEHGSGTELWTLKRIRLLIERLFGVSLPFRINNIVRVISPFEVLSPFDWASQQYLTLHIATTLTTPAL